MRLEEHCINGRKIKAPMKAIWHSLTDFYDWKWLGLIKSMDVRAAHSSNEVGAFRVVNGVFHEQLVAIDNECLTFRYAIVDGPGDFGKERVESFFGDVSVESIDSEWTAVTWLTSWINRLPNKTYKATDLVCKRILQDLEQHMQIETNRLQV